MNSELQTFVALVIVTIAAAWLIWRSVGKRRSSGCGGGECGAISPDVRKLQAAVRKHGRRER